MWVVDIKPRSQLSEKAPHLPRNLSSTVCENFESCHLSQLALNSWSSCFWLSRLGQQFWPTMPGFLPYPLDFCYAGAVDAIPERPHAPLQAGSWVGRGPRKIQIAITKQWLPVTYMISGTLLPEDARPIQKMYTTWGEALLVSRRESSQKQLSILWCRGQDPTTKTYWEQTINSVVAEKPLMKINWLKPQQGTKSQDCLGRSEQAHKQWSRLYKKQFTRLMSGYVVLVDFCSLLGSIHYSLNLLSVFMKHK